jgi:alkyl sulfatase BDS1-like metallo-beta-lactamase superfamily hydrolase
MYRTWTCLALIITFLTACSDTPPPPPAAAVLSHEDLTARNEEFEPHVVKVTEGVHVAIGYALGNSILIEGDDGVIIVDVTESMETAQAIKTEFDKITTKPVKAIIYTHNHGDHIFGGPVFAGDDNPNIYAHELTNDAIDKILSLIRPIIRKRTYRMFGLHLDESAVPNAGIGPPLAMREGTTLGLLRPTHTFTDTLDLEIAGVKLTLMHAPGETDDQLLVWLPEKKILLPGDNIYKAFPNLYTIRGTAFRDPSIWVASLDKMRQLEPEILVPSHTEPVHGKEKIVGILTDYRDAIQYVHDQTVYGMNLGMTPDEIVEEISLPAHLRDSEYLVELYGDIDLCVRSIYSGYLGPFDGNPSNLKALTTRQRSGRIAKLAGGNEALKEQLKLAAAEGDTQWALELTDTLLWLMPEDTEVRDHRIAALETLAEKTVNPNLRHYYLSSASELRGVENTPYVLPTPDLANNVPLETIFKVMPASLVARNAIHVDQIVTFIFPDVGETYSIHIRKGVAEVQPFAMPNAHNTVTVNSSIFKEIVAELRNPLTAVANGDMQITGSKMDLAAFMQLFDKIE